MIDARDRQAIQTWNKNRNGQQVLRLKRTSQEAGEELSTFCREFSALAPSVIIKPWEEESPDGPQLPGLVVKDNILYAAEPLEMELLPFLEGLNQIQSGEPALPNDILEALDRIPAPCALTLYIARHCPHCPGVVKALLPLAIFCEKVHLTIIDGSLFPETAQEDRVMSAPCLLLGNEFRWTGSVSPAEVIDMMVRQDPAKLSAKSLRGIIEEGNAQWIADKMVEADIIFPAFMELLLHDTWSVRLGAMVVVETLGQDHPGLAKRICPRLIDEFPGKEIPVQGDILYALGQAGDQNIKEWIARTLTGMDHPDLIEAGKDALDDIDSRVNGH